MVKRVIVTLILALLFLTSCGAAYGSDKTQYCGFISTDQVLLDNGLIFLDFGDNHLAKFTDFDKLITVPICPKPNCSHTDENECPALGIDGTIFVYGNSLCWLESEIGYDDSGNTTDITTLYMSDVDSTNRRQVAQLDGYRVDGGAFVNEDRVYFCASDVEYKDGMSTGAATEYLYAYDFGTGKFEQLVFLSEGDDAGAAVRGSFGDSLFIIFQGATQAGSSENHDSFRHYALYSMETNELEILDETVVNASGDCLICFNDDGGVYVRRLNGEEIQINSDRIIATSANDYQIINDKLVSVFYGYAYDLKTGEEYDIAPLGVITAYYKGKYIVKNNGTGEVSAVSEDELFTPIS